MLAAGQCHVVSYISSKWNSTSLANATGSRSGSHIAVDECGRIWYAIGAFGLRIYDPSGLEIASWNMSLGSDTIFEIVLLPNRVLLATQVNAQTIIQYDPQLTCY
ncbi:unnamed protein product [Rotaria socialis]|uniref:Uncharacterized protein n=1 Tax=Rotaria socialis TaxID=392032 RepID=A0A821RHA8_9BILA|nr:unnamed protein product [Rotaria socialis]